MSEITIPSWILPVREEIELVDDNTIRFEPTLARGMSQRQDFGGPRFKISRTHIIRTSEEANFMSTILSLRGAQNTVRTCVKRVLRGTLGGSELVTNGSFINGTAGWSVFNNSTHLVRDRISTFRVGEAQNGGFTSFGIVDTTTPFTLNQYQAYVLRASVLKGRGDYTYTINFGNASAGTELGQASSTDSALITAGGISLDVLGYAAIYSVTVTGTSYNDYFLCNQISASRCALVDNGLNTLLNSADFTAGSWGLLNITVGAFGGAGYDLSFVADTMLETSTNGAHGLSQGFTATSAQQEFTFTVAVKASLRSFVRLSMLENTGSTTCQIDFNLSSVTAFSPVSGANWTATRGKIAPLGGGWYAVSLTSRKTNAATSMAAGITAGSNSTTFSYAGSAGSTALVIQDATLTMSSTPSRLIRTTSTASTGTLQMGRSLYLKGLPPSTNGLALPGEYVEINKELKRITAPLDSDALGTGYLQFEPEIINAAAEGSPIIFFEPFGRFLISNIQTRQRVGDIELSYDLEQIYE